MKNTFNPDALSTLVLAWCKQTQLELEQGKVLSLPMVLLKTTLSCHPRGASLSCPASLCTWSGEGTETVLSYMIINGDSC